jgi:hypothetical protein
MIDYVLLPTIQHTGTWFLLDILQKAGFTTVPYNPEWTDKNTVLYMHYPLSVGNGILPQEEHKFCSLGAIEWIYSKFDNCLMIVPIRDILAALITRQVRHPDQPHKYIIDGFISFAQDFDGFNPFYFSIDLFENYKTRVDLLSSLESATGKDLEYKNSIAREWQPKNTSGNSWLKEAYYQEDIEKIKQTIPVEWEYLMKSREILQPFFEKLGYKDLLWFEGNND